MKFKKKIENLNCHSHVCVGWRYCKWKQGYGHAQVTDGQVYHKELCWLQGGLLSIGHEQQDAIPKHRQHTWDTEQYNVKS